MSDCKKLGELESRLAAIEAQIKQIKQQMEDELNKPLSQSAAAHYLHISRNTLVKHTEMGLLSAIPGTTKYRVSELDRYKAKRQRSQ